jgi:hypothetical protein
MAASASARLTTSTSARLTTPSPARSLTAVSAGLTTPASARPAARERFHLTTGNSAARRQHVQATGALTARGYALAGDFASGHAVSRLVFRRGRIRLVTRATHRSVSVPNPSTCKFTEVYSGDYVIRGGTSRYQHAGGSGTYVSRIFGKLKKARGGGCGSGLASFWHSTRTSGSLHW